MVGKAMCEESKDIQMNNWVMHTGTRKVWQCRSWSKKPCSKRDIAEQRHVIALGKKQCLLTQMMTKHHSYLRAIMEYHSYVYFLQGM